MREAGKEREREKHPLAAAFPETPPQPRNWGVTPRPRYVPCPGPEPAASGGTGRPPPAQPRWPGHYPSASQPNGPNRGGHFHAETKGPRRPAGRCSGGDRAPGPRSLHAPNAVRPHGGRRGAGTASGGRSAALLAPLLAPGGEAPSQSRRPASGLRKGVGGCTLAPRRRRRRDLETHPHPRPHRSHARGAPRGGKRRQVRAPRP